MRAVMRLCALLLTAAAAIGAARAHDRIYTLFDWRSGLNAGTVTGVAQDADGFIWISTSSGLLRYDGRRFVRITDSPCMMINDRSPEGPVYVISGGVLQRVRGTTLEVLRDSAGTPIAHGWTWERTTPDGSLWTVGPQRTLVVRPDGAILRPKGIGFHKGEASPIGTTTTNEALCWLDGWITAISADGAVRRLVRVKRPAQAPDPPDSGT